MREISFGIETEGEIPRSLPAAHAKARREIKLVDVKGELDFANWTRIGK